MNMQLIFLLWSYFTQTQLLVYDKQISVYVQLNHCHLDWVHVNSPLKWFHLSILQHFKTSFSNLKSYICVEATISRILCQPKNFVVWIFGNCDSKPFENIRLGKNCFKTRKNTVRFILWTTWIRTWIRK